MKSKYFSLLFVSFALIGCNNANPSNSSTTRSSSSSTPEVKYTITFEPEGGEASFLSKEVTYNLPVGELPSWNKEGCCFYGWFTEEVGGEQILPTTVYTYNSDITLYAQYGSLNLLTPLDGSTVTQNIVTVSYTTDIDSIYLFEIFYSTTDVFPEEGVISYDLYTDLPSLSDGKYYWYVRGYDINGSTVCNSSIFEFVFENE